MKPQTRVGLEIIGTLGIVALLAVAPLAQHTTIVVVGCAVAALSVMGWALHSVLIVPLGAFCVVALGLAWLALPSQLWLAGGLAAYVGATFWQEGRVLPRWLVRGRLDGEVLALTLGAVAFSGSVLLAWFFILRPNLDDIVATFVPDWPVAALVGYGVLFSLLNAAVEEGAYRGVVVNALDRVLVPWQAELAQALAFGLLHIHGFPRGWLGVAMATVFGLMMGAIRRRAGGMLAPWLAHVGTDLVVSAIVLFLA